MASSILAPGWGRGGGPGRGEEESIRRKRGERKTHPAERQAAPPFTSFSRPMQEPTGPSVCSHD